MPRIRTGLLSLLFGTAAVVYAWPSATIWYYALVALHLVVGLAFLLLTLFFFARTWRSAGRASRAGWSLLVIGGILGVILIFTGTSRNDFPLLYAHLGSCLLGIGLLVGNWGREKEWFSAGSVSALLTWAFVAVILGAISWGAWWTRSVPWQKAYRIVNPPLAPATMNDEGGGAAGAYFPSSAEVQGNSRIPARFFMESKTCQRCHADIYRQWASSAHHFSSFNNQWYRKSIEYMQDVVGVKPSKWCAGCHDPALLFTGLMDRPVREIENTPEAHAGLDCMMCHSIVAVQGTMGQGGYVLEYPPLHDLATSSNPFLRRLDDFLIKLNPEPHRRTFLKPFLRNQTAEFCSVCHKLHLDVAVNHYRWSRGFNEYDNWQASGVSGQGARSFYYPPKPYTCPDCHMPEVKSTDFGNDHGFIHSHRFLAANTALAYENEDQTQLSDTAKFLRNHQVSVDIFGISPERVKPREGAELQQAPAPGIQTTFGVGEEMEFKAPQVAREAASPAAELTAPLGRVVSRVRRGETVRVDVVVRTRNVGHFFPGGTVDAFDLWLELIAEDAEGHIFFWSGPTEGGGKGPVDPSAHFYRSLLIDAHGNPINKRNAWAERAVVYVHLIPPGAADVVHYRLHIPENVGDHIRLIAKLNYRKFSWWNTHFAFAGVHDPTQAHPDVSPGFDDTKWVFTGSTSKDSGKRKGIPVLPIVVLAQQQRGLDVLPANAPQPRPRIKVDPRDWERWNDYGIGLFLQGDLLGAESAFEKVAEAAPNRPDGWVNVGRVRLQEGNLAGAKVVLAHALQVSPSLASAHFFYAEVLRDEGRYGNAAVELGRVLEQYPRDRVALNDLGRILFLQRRYPEAIQQFQKVLAIDPEDLEANYNLMLCHEGMGQSARARQYEIRYLRFKANESEQALTGPYLRAHPFDNNERQPIHEHSSAPLPFVYTAPRLPQRPQKKGTP